MEKGFFSNELYNTVLYESEHFIVVPSLGSLVEGWVLIAPKEEILNFSLLNNNQYTELECLVNDVRSFQKVNYGNSVIFEHGPSNKCSNTGCGVDYAHLYLVPIESDLIDGINKFLKLDFKWIEINNISFISKLNIETLDYLYYRSPNNKHFITFREDFPSQIFRQVIAYYKGLPNQYNWRLFPEYNTINKTIIEFEKLKVSHEF